MSQLGNATRFFVTSLLVGSIGWCQTLTVHSGETKVIDNSYNPIYLDKLVMEANATIKLSEDLPNRIWKVQIRNATFGQDAAIVASGSAGPDGSSIPGVPAAADECRGGNGGATGGNGKNGTAGIDIDMLVGISELDHLIIDNSGGKGGVVALGNMVEKAATQIAHAMVQREEEVALGETVALEEIPGISGSSGIRSVRFPQYKQLRGKR